MSQRLKPLLPEEQRGGLKKRSMPAWIGPMLATLTDDPFSSKDWIYERKFDGERCLAYRSGKQLRLMTRNKNNVTKTYPELRDALLAQKTDHFIVDGEIVAFEGKTTSFSRLQQRMKLTNPEDVRRNRVAVYYYLFDVLYAEGYRVTALPLHKRKELLRALIAFHGPLRFSTHHLRTGEAFFHSACRRGWEGVIAKQATSAYLSTRSNLWLKFKCVKEQELVIGGYTDPQRSRIGLGALLIGYYDRGKLRYAGKVGTGYDEETLRDLRKRLSKIERDEPPFASNQLPSRGVHWTAPKLVAQFRFTEWTGDGRLRHPRFLGLRRDKEPRQVTREKGNS